MFGNCLRGYKVVMFFCLILREWFVLFLFYFYFILFYFYFILFYFILFIFCELLCDFFWGFPVWQLPQRLQSGDVLLFDTKRMVCFIFIFIFILFLFYFFIFFCELLCNFLGEFLVWQLPQRLQSGDVLLFDTKRMVSFLFFLYFLYFILFYFYFYFILFLFLFSFIFLLFLFYFYFIFILFLFYFYCFFVNYCVIFFGGVSCLAIASEITKW